MDEIKLRKAADEAFHKLLDSFTKPEQFDYFKVYLTAINELDLFRLTKIVQKNN